MFRDRTEAGRRLGAKLAELKFRDPVVLALPRGGVPVAAEVAKALDAPLDLVIVRKVGAPAIANSRLRRSSTAIPQTWCSTARSWKPMASRKRTSPT